MLQRVASVGRFKSSPVIASLSRSFSQWGHVEQGPPDAILGVVEAFKASEAANKINLSAGTYRDDDNQPWVLPSVREAEKRVLSKSDYNHEYAPISGIAAFNDLSKRLAFGDDAKDLDSIVTMQSLSGTGSLRTLAGFVARHWPDTNDLPTVFVPQPTWGNHLQIFQHAGMKTEYYRYYKPSTCGLDFEGLRHDILNAPENSIILFHATAHNPTGVDLNHEQWDEMCEVLKKRRLLTLFDMAYQGFASGDCDYDAYSLRKFQSEGMPFMLAQSFAKNFGLYGQRCGAASISCGDEAEAARVFSQFKIIARGIYSNPPLHGARIVTEILSDSGLKQSWLGDVKVMADRIGSMRTLLREKVEACGSKRDWNHITDQTGMFCFTGLVAEEVDEMVDEHKVFMTRNGRISMAGVNTKNVDEIAQALHVVSAKSKLI